MRCTAYRAQTSRGRTILFGIPWLVVRAAENDGAWRVVGALAFGCGGLLMFATSTLYHAVRRPTAKAVLRRLDHFAIYLLIAGTYTPFTIGVVRGSLGWSLFGIVWALAIVGVTVKLTGALLRIPLASTLIYVLIGWIGPSGLQAAVGWPNANPVRVARGWRSVLHGRYAFLPAEEPVVCARRLARRLAPFRVGWRCLSFHRHT